MSINPGLVDAHAVVLVVRTARGLGLSVGARLCSDVVGSEAHAEESVASDDRLGLGDTDGVGSKFGAGIVMLSTKQHHPQTEY